MRSGLIQLEGIRKTFTATFSRYGIKRNWHGFTEETILLLNVKDSSGRTATTHIWFPMTKGFEKLGGLEEGTLVQFDARVKSYRKGYKKDVYDFKLNNPTKIKMLKGCEKNARNIFKI